MPPAVAVPLEDDLGRLHGLRGCEDRQRIAHQGQARGCMAGAAQSGADTGELALHDRGCAHQAEIALPINITLLDY